MLRTFKKYLKIYTILIHLNLGKLFAYRANFINSCLAHSVWAITTIVAMILLTSKTSHVFGWTRNELLILAGVYNIVSSIFYLFFARNFAEIPNTIHFGRLDSILTKPVSSQFLVTCTHINVTHSIRFLLGLGFTLFILSQMHVVLTVVTVINFIFILFLAILILYSFWLLVMTLTLWFTKLSNLIDLLYQIMNVSKYPQEIFRGGSVLLLVTLFPLTLVVVAPTKAILDKMLVGDLVWPTVFAVGLFLASRKFWNFALRSYTSASG